MVFNSIQFALFLPLVFAIYWLLRKNLRLQNLFVVVASYVFYGWWDWRFLCLIALTSFLSWGSGLLIANSGDAPPCGCSHAKPWLTLNIAINLMILGVFKYCNFFVDSFCSLFNIQSSIALNVILPVGISFYTFQALSYSIDVYRGSIKPTKDIVAFFAYVSFFPQLVAGPIERATNLLPQFEKPRVFDYEEGVDGMRRILWGLFKKVVIADNCAKYVNIVWDKMGSGVEGSGVAGSTLALAAVLFAFQIYGDFSGYSDIAIGSAKLFGVNLKDNFLTPYVSRNVAEFWKRWHISLNTWFVDYVYIPLGGSRPKIPASIINAENYTKWITIRNTFVIFLLSGLWHGANWTYVGWGLYHALLFVPLILMGRTKAYKGAATWRQLPQILLTFALASIGWIIFRAPSFGEAWGFLTGMCSKSLLSVPYLINQSYYVPTFLCLALMVLVEWVNRDKRHGLDLIGVRSHVVKFSIYIGLIALLFWFGAEAETFIYFQF